MMQRVALSRSAEGRERRGGGPAMAGRIGVRCAAAAALLAGLAFAGDRAAAQPSDAPRVEGRLISACINSTRFPESTGRNCSAEAQRIVANQFCRLNETAPVVSWQVGNIQAQDLSVLDEPNGDRTKARWIRTRTSGQIFYRIVCTDPNAPDTTPPTQPDNSPPDNNPPDNDPPDRNPPDRNPPDRNPPPRTDRPTRPDPAVDDIDETRLPGMRRERR